MFGIVSKRLNVSSYFLQHNGRPIVLVFTVLTSLLTSDGVPYMGRRFDVNVM